MAFFPSAIISFRTIANLPGVVYDAAKATHFYVEDFLALIEEIAAIENTLGENPQGSSDTVADRLDAIEAAEAADTLSAAKFIYNQKPLETPDGSVVTFTLPEAWVSGKLVISADGIRLSPIDDYTVNEGAHTVTIGRAPSSIVLADYIKA